MNPTVKNLVAYRLSIFAVSFLVAVAWIGEAGAQKVRVAMPAKSVTFLNFYVGDKFGIYKAEGLDVSLEVIKTEVGVSGMVAGELDYTSAIGSAMRAAATRPAIWAMSTITIAPTLSAIVRKAAKSMIRG